MLYHWLGSEAEEYRAPYERSFVCDNGTGAYSYDFVGRHGATVLGHERSGIAYIDGIALVTALG